MEHIEDYAALPDEELIGLVRASDIDAEQALYQRYKRIVRARARTYFILGGDNDDLIQEGMIGLYKAVCEYAPDKAASFHSFASLCIKRQILTAIKHAARKKHTPLNQYVSLNRSAFSDDDDDERTLLDMFENVNVSDPADTIITREWLELVVSAIREQLSPFEQQVLELYLRGYSYLQIAEELDKPAKSIDNAIQRVKKKLEKIRLDT